MPTPEQVFSNLSGQLAEVELISATAATLAALGLTGCTIRVNDRRILAGILDFCGFAPDRQAQALISIDKLDKIGAAGVVAELAEGGADAAAVLGGILERIEPALAEPGDAPMREHRSGSAVGYAWAQDGLGYSLVGRTDPATLHPLANEIRRTHATNT